jgi:hypothetical protein
MAQPKSELPHAGLTAVAGIVGCVRVCALRLVGRRWHLVVVDVFRCGGGRCGAGWGRL